MEKALIYIFNGTIHYISLLFGFLDYIDLSFMFVIIGFIFLSMIINKEVRKQCFGIIKPFINIMKNFFGMTILIFIISYYIYITLNFEENISLIYLIFTLYLFLKDYIKIYMNLLPNSKLSIWDLSKEICVPIILLFVYQWVLMFERDSFSNISNVSWSLIFIPIFILLIIILKYLLNLDEMNRRWNSRLKINNFQFVKLFTISLFRNFSYEKNIRMLNITFTNNLDSSYKKLKYVNKALINEVKEKKKNEHKKNKKEKIKINKVYEYIWLLNILCYILCITDYRFYDINYGVCYYLITTVLFIYFWIDLIKYKKIENNYDFCLWMILLIIFIIFVVPYFISIQKGRISEMLFLMPLFVYLHLKSYNCIFPNILKMPFLSQKNFFGLNPNDYKPVKKGGKIEWKKK